MMLAARRTLCFRRVLLWLRRRLSRRRLRATRLRTAWRRRRQRRRRRRRRRRRASGASRFNLAQSRCVNLHIDKGDRVPCHTRAHFHWGLRGSRRTNLSGRSTNLMRTACARGVRRRPPLIPYRHELDGDAWYGPRNCNWSIMHAVQRRRQRQQQKQTSKGRALGRLKPPRGRSRQQPALRPLRRQSPPPD